MGVPQGAVISYDVDKDCDCLLSYVADDGDVADVDTADSDDDVDADPIGTIHKCMFCMA